MTSEPGSFARKTIVERKPQILREVSEAHTYPPDIQAALRAYADEIASAPVEPLREQAPDVGLWNGAWAELEGRTWLDLPWYFAETFFYRRLMEVVRFYQPGPWQGIDPFGPQKSAQLVQALPAFVALVSADERPASALDAFRARVVDALWGNRADLSNRTISARAGVGQEQERLLIDDTPRIWHAIFQRTSENRTPIRCDVVADNSGLELLLDLRLIDWLLSQGWAREVHLHLKRMPFFVSDARLSDLEQTLDRLAGASTLGEELAARLASARTEGAFVLQDDPFWSTCLSYHQLPSHIHRELSRSDLVLFKGDVNYRRLLDDRHWPHTAHMAEIAGHLPAPFCALRTLKGELIVDLQPGQAEALAAADPTWMINGERGVIQFVIPG